MLTMMILPDGEFRQYKGTTVGKFMLIICSKPAGAPMVDRCIVVSEDGVKFKGVSIFLSTRRYCIVVARRIDT